jgi:hypothetical protein
MFGPRQKCGHHCIVFHGLKILLDTKHRTYIIYSVVESISDEASQPPTPRNEVTSAGRIKVNGKHHHNTDSPK